MAVRFFSEEVSYQLKSKLHIKRWIAGVITSHHKKVGDINFIFCNDSYLHSINVSYLNHDTLTDIITFNNSEKEPYIDADIYISIERVAENATALKVPYEEELHRVIIHGILHLLGYKDKTPEQKKVMRLKEDECLSLLQK